MPDVGKLLKLRIWHEKRHPFSGWHLAKVRVQLPIYAAGSLTTAKMASVGIPDDKDTRVTRLSAGHFAENLDDGEILLPVRPLAGCE